MWHLGTRISNGLVNAGLRVGLNGLRGLFQPKHFCDSMKEMLCGIWPGPTFHLQTRSTANTCGTNMVFQTPRDRIGGILLTLSSN